jgi:membrane-bound inhibitor of C-type lysozyme
LLLGGNTGSTTYFQKAVLVADNFVVQTIGGIPVVEFDSTANVQIGTTGAAAKLNVQGAGTQLGFQVRAADTTGMMYGCKASLSVVSTENSANAILFLRKDGTTNRSINAAGTINASGADYAEYMVKAPGCGPISKGDVIGVDAEGRLTDKWVDAIAFVVKSTDPSYVGGDTWGSGLDGEALEAARQCVDRIAFSGQVPANLLGANPGDYIVPEPGDAGCIAAKAVANPTFPEYMASIGRVIAIEADGRARIIVKVA